jgi:hypothetical protein
MDKKPQNSADREMDPSRDQELLESGKRWFAEARAVTERDEHEIAAWIDRHAGGFDETGERQPSIFLKAIRR